MRPPTILRARPGSPVRTVTFNDDRASALLAANGIDDENELLRRLRSGESFFIGRFEYLLWPADTVQKVA